ncbi:MAG: PotD/PotF family extracellular solute-binding protein [Actinomycetota bacterium]
MRHLDRKGFLALSGTTGLAAFMAACGGSSSSDGGGDAGGGGAADAGTTAAAAPKVDPATEPGGPIEIFTWAGYDNDPEAGAPWMWEQYETGPYGADSPLTWTFLEDDTQALSKVASGYSPDISHPCMMWVPQWKDGGLIQPLDLSLFPDYDGIPEAVRAGGEIDGQTWFVPFDVGFTSLTYDADAVDFDQVGGEETWQVLLDPRYAGKMSFFSDPTAIIGMSHMMNEGAVDPNVLTTEQIAAAKETALKWKPNLRNYWTSQTDTVNDFVNGNLLVTYTWPDGYWRIKNHPKMEGRNIKYMQPKEGRGAWVCGMVLGAGTAQPGRAQLAMASTNTPAAAAKLTDVFQYAAAQKDGVVDLIEDKELIKAFEIDNPAAWEPPNTWFEHSIPNHREVIAAGEEVKAS